jgi:hypothetical protein
MNFSVGLSTLIAWFYELYPAFFTDCSIFNLDKLYPRMLAKIIL